mmetsp:Transcript_33862/g.51049  ORF Transcript_33862/g.51049 Transcript_33862/m.51049 type:complete len:80 (+) Transcript_33862:1061-1300(+)
MSIIVFGLATTGSKSTKASSVTGVYLHQKRHHPPESNACLDLVEDLDLSRLSAWTDSPKILVSCFLLSLLELAVAPPSL